MCRLLTFSLTETITNKTKIIQDFKQLSITGAVPCGIEKGHTDGWGIALYADSQEPYVYKSVMNASEDGATQVTSLLENSVNISGVAHLRKKTVGEASLENTHPFVSGLYSFIHNGTVAKGEGEPYGNVACLCKGDTDSERLFMWFLEIKKSTELHDGDALKKMLIDTANKYPEYSSLNCILHTSASIYIARFYNENHTKAKDLCFDNYYTLYLGKGKDNNSMIVCSEKIAENDFDFVLLPNYSLTSFNLATRQSTTELLREILS